MKNILQTFIKTSAKIEEGKPTLCANNVPEISYVLF